MNKHFAKVSNKKKPKPPPEPVNSTNTTDAPEDGGSNTTKTEGKLRHSCGGLSEEQGLE